MCPSHRKNNCYVEYQYIFMFLDSWSKRCSVYKFDGTPSVMLILVLLFNQFCNSCLLFSETNIK